MFTQRSRTLKSPTRELGTPADGFWNNMGTLRNGRGDNGRTKLIYFIATVFGLVAACVVLSYLNVFTPKVGGNLFVCTIECAASHCR